jgi:hypothetical protein
MEPQPRRLFMKTIDRMVLAAAACLACAALTGPAAADTAEEANGQAASSMNGPSDAMNAPADATKTDAMKTDATKTDMKADAKTDAKNAIASWPDKTKTAALALIEKYGPPDGVMDKMLAWNDKDQWKMVGVFRDAIPAADPVAHDVYIGNKISYSVPEDKVGALAKFDHSLVVDQIRGTLTAQGDSEKTNTLTLNLANEIVTGKRDVASAKIFLKKTLKESLAGKSSPYTDGLMFTPTAATPLPGYIPDTQP